MNDDFLWTERYRPKTVADCILPLNLKKSLVSMVVDNRIPNLIFAGSTGVGKTTAARALCEETDSDYILINGSLESGIDTLRVKIMGFATSVSLMGGRKVIIVDEADNLSAAAQLGFRGVIEEVSDNCTFIFTCNHPNRIIDAIHSRCATIEFKIAAEEKSIMASAFMGRIRNILLAEKVDFDPQVVAEILMKFFPDYRKILGELQKYAVAGKIDVGALASLSDVDIDQLVKFLKVKDFKSVREWVGSNSDADPTILMRKIYDNTLNLFKGNSAAVAVVLLGKYQYQASFVADQEINTMAFLTEILCECEFR